MWRGVVRMVGSCRLEAGLGDTLSKNLERLDPRARTGNKRGLSEPPQGASSAAPVRVRGAAELFRKGIPQDCPAPMRRIQVWGGVFERQFPKPARHQSIAYKRVNASHTARKYKLRQELYSRPMPGLIP